MNNRQKAINLLGLSQKAGKLVSGTDTVIAKIRHQQIYLVIISSDMEANSVKKISAAAHKYKVQTVSFLTSAELSQALGKKRKVAAICDAGFSRAILQKIDEGV